VTRVVLVTTSPRVATGLLSAQAWQELTVAGIVLATESAAGLAGVLRAAGVEVSSLDDATPVALARAVGAAAADAGGAVVLLGPEGRHSEASQLAAALGAGDESSSLVVESVAGTWDLPGARLLDVVTTMDRLRSPGGCPWDAEQDHVTLAPYLLEEAYEAFQTIEDGDLEALRDELGDVLLQVAFHARMAEEQSEDVRWSIDDVAAGLVEKLVRRHPHVFADATVDSAEAVHANWEAIKSAERGGASPLSSVPLALPALTLASTLQRKAAKAGLDEGELSDSAAAFADAVDRYLAGPTEVSAGALLWALVAVLRSADIDPERALRARARAFRESSSPSH